MCRRDEQAIWYVAWQQLQALDRAWDNLHTRQIGVSASREWLAAQVQVPRLANLARLLQPEMTRSQFWSVLVPIEREVARLKVTDVTILDADLPESAQAQTPKLPVTVVVDSIRSAFNLGGVLRTAECFGVSEALLCGYTPLPTQPQVARAALGAEQLVPWRQVENILEALKQLKSGGIRCVALETVTEAASVTAFEWTFPCALVLGNERFGLNHNVVAHCDAVVRIPLFGRKNSLNVVSAMAIALHAIRQHYEANTLTQ